MNENNLITREQIERRLAEEGSAARLNLSDQDLSGLDLSYLDLSRADFSRANLSRVSFIQSRLKGAKLIETNLSGAELQDTDASAADFFKAKLVGAKLVGATLRNAYLVDCNFNKANLSEARLPDADLRGSSLSETDLTSADLSGVELSGVDLTRTRLRNNAGSLPDLRGANLYKVKLTQQQFEWLAEAEVNLDGVEIAEPMVVAPQPVSGRAEPTTIKLIFQTGGELAEVSNLLAALTGLATGLTLLSRGNWAAWFEYACQPVGRRESQAGLKVVRLQAGPERLELELQLPEAAVATAISEALKPGETGEKAIWETAQVAATQLVNRLTVGLDPATRSLAHQNLLGDLLKLHSKLATGTGLA